MKVYVFCNSVDAEAAERAQWVIGVAIREDGVCIGSHLHSSLAWMRADWSLDGLRGKDIKESCPDGCEIEVVEPEDVDTHEGLNKALELNVKMQDGE